MASEPLPTPASAVEPQANISPMGRIFGVLFSPKSTFEDIARKPSWLLPVIISTILGIIATVALNQRMNWRQYLSEQFEKNPHTAQLAPDQKEKQLDISVKVTTYIVYVAGILGSVLFAVIVAGVMMLAYNLLAGAHATYSQSLAISAHTLVVGLVSTPIFLLVIFLRDRGSIDPNNPVATNFAAFLPEDAAKWLMTLCRSIDIFSIWQLILIAIGFAAVNPKKLKGAKPYLIVFSVWGAFVLVKTLWAFIFS
jgi:Yip1 domain